MDVLDLTTALSKRLMADGLYIEAGWHALREMTVKPTAPQFQLDALRMAFFAGAHHTFSGMVATMDADAEPTQADYDRMTAIYNELEAWLQKFKQHIAKTEGSA